MTHAFHACMLMFHILERTVQRHMAYAATPPLKAAISGILLFKIIARSMSTWLALVVTGKFQLKIQNET